MAATGGWDWLFLVLAIILAAFALYLVGTSFLGRRSLGRPRTHCPKCLYDMCGALQNDAGAFKCPECGRASTATQLRRPARRRRRLALAAMVLTLSYLVFATPRIAARGWLGTIPTTALIVASPMFTDEDSANWPIVVNYSQPTPPPSLTVRAYRELGTRVDDRDLWSWQVDLLVEVILASHPRRLGDSGGYARLASALDRQKRLNSAAIGRLKRHVHIQFESRERWPAGVPLQCIPTIDGWSSTRAGLTPRDWPLPEGVAPLILQRNREDFIAQQLLSLPRAKSTDVLVEWTPLPAGSMNPVFVVREANDDWTTTFALPITVTNSINDVLTPVSSAEIDSALARAPVPILHAQGAAAHLFWGPFKNLPIDEPTTLAVRIEARKNGRVFFSGRMWWFLGALQPHYAPRVQKTVLHRAADAPDDTPPGPWTLILESDPELALRNFECDRYWEGRLELEAVDVERDR